MSCNKDQQRQIRKQSLNRIRPLLNIKAKIYSKYTCNLETANFFKRQVLKIEHNDIFTKNCRKVQAVYQWAEKKN